MKTIQRVIYTGFAAVAIAAAAMPVFPAPGFHDRTLLQGPDFQWYAQVGRDEGTLYLLQPASRPGWIWSPQHWEWNGRDHVWVEGRWVRDDHAEQVAVHNLGVPPTMLAETPAQPERVITFERR